MSVSPFTWTLPVKSPTRHPTLSPSTTRRRSSWLGPPQSQPAGHRPRAQLLYGDHADPADRLDALPDRSRPTALAAADHSDLQSDDQRHPPDDDQRATAAGLTTEGVHQAHGSGHDHCVVAGALLVGLANSKDIRTLYPVVGGEPDTSQPAVVAALGIALYVAGAGVAVALIGSLMLRQSSHAVGAEQSIRATPQWEGELRSARLRGDRAGRRQGVQALWVSVCPSTRWVKTVVRAIATDTVTRATAVHPPWMHSAGLLVRSPP